MTRKKVYALLLALIMALSIVVFVSSEPPPQPVNLAAGRHPNSNYGTPTQATLDKLTDGNYDSDGVELYYNPIPPDMVFATQVGDDRATGYIEIDLGSVCEISRYRVNNYKWPTAYGTNKSWKLFTSTNRQTWTQVDFVQDYSYGNSGSQTYIQFYDKEFTSVEARYVRLSVLELSNGTKSDGTERVNTSVRMYEMEIYGIRPELADVMPVADPTDPQTPEGYVLLQFAEGAHGTLGGSAAFNVKVGTAFSKVTVPTVTADEGYEHSGWDPVLPADDALVNEATVYTAQYTTPPKILSAGIVPSTTFNVSSRTSLVRLTDGEYYRSGGPYSRMPFEIAVPDPDFAAQVGDDRADGYFEFDFGSVCTVSKYRLHNYRYPSQYCMNKSWKLFTSVDGQTWTQVHYEPDGSYKTSDYVQFYEGILDEPVQARYVRLSILELFVGGSIKSDEYVWMYEIEIYGTGDPVIPEEPEEQTIPADGSVLREIVVAEADATTEIEWIPTQDMRTAKGSIIINFFRGYLYKAPPYNRDIKCSREMFQSAIDADKNYTGGTRPKTAFGMDCGSFVWNAISRVTGVGVPAPENYSADLLNANGRLRLTGNIAMEAADSNDTGKTINRYTEQEIFEAYALARTGDVILSYGADDNHVALLTEDAVVVRNADNTIDGANSYVMRSESGSNEPKYYYENLQTGEIESEYINEFSDLYEIVSDPNKKLLYGTTIIVGNKTSFNTIYKGSYLPVTLKAYHDGRTELPDIKYHYKFTADNILERGISGRIDSNYRLIEIVVTIYNADDDSEVYSEAFYGERSLSRSLTADAAGFNEILKGLYRGNYRITITAKTGPILRLGDPLRETELLNMEFTSDRERPLVVVGGLVGFDLDAQVGTDMYSDYEDKYNAYEAFDVKCLLNGQEVQDSGVPQEVCLPLPETWLGEPVGCWHQKADDSWEEITGEVQTREGERYFVFSQREFSPFILMGVEQAVIPTDPGNTTVPDGYVRVTFAQGEHGTLEGDTAFNVKVGTEFSRVRALMPEVEAEAGWQHSGWSPVLPDDAAPVNEAAVYTAQYEADQPATTSVEVTKEWDDANNLIQMRPASVTVQLYADGTAVEGKTLTLNADNNWAGTFTDLPVNENDRPIIYTVDETAVPLLYLKVITGTATDGFTIINIHRLTGGWPNDRLSADRLGIILSRVLQLYRIIRER